MAYSNRRGKIIFEGYGDHRERTRHALLFYFPANGSTNPDVFSLEPSSASQNLSSIRISRVSEELGNKQPNKPHRLTDILLL